MLNLHDKFDTELSDGDILFNGSDYYHIYLKAPNEVEMISCRKGYKHNVVQSDLVDFNKVGHIYTHAYLLECD